MSNWVSSNWKRESFRIPGAVPAAANAIGWDHNTVNAGTAGAPTFQKYKLPRLKGGDWISATLAWDRILTLDDKNNNGEYDAKAAPVDDFINPKLAKLDLLLMPAGETDPDKAAWSSISPNYSVEHLFFRLDATDAEYELWVKNTSADQTKYSLAWWAEKAAVPGPDKKDLKGLTWTETSPDGLRLPGEVPLSNVVVKLHAAATGEVVDTRWTDDEGEYAFQSIAPGTYYVTFEAPYGYGFTTPNVGMNLSDTIDSDAVPQGGDPLIGKTGPIVVSLADVANVDAGFVKLNYGSIGDFVWRDSNADGIQGPNAPPFILAEQGGEPGMAGVQVDLFKSDDTYVGTQWTSGSGTWAAGDGSYLFTDVAPGDYYLQFHRPDRYRFSPQRAAAADRIDSDSAADGRTPVFHLDLGQNDTSLDAGLVLSGGSVGDRVWFDWDHDGTQDDTELGLGGLAVELYTAGGSLADETTTNQNGDYWFGTVSPGSYYLKFDRPDGTAFTTANAGNDDLDSDVTEATAGTTATFAVALGQVKDNLDAGIVYPLLGDRV